VSLDLIKSSTVLYKLKSCDTAPEHTIKPLKQAVLKLRWSAARQPSRSHSFIQIEETAQEVEASEVRQPYHSSI
jgi:hypothetical protein